jgi:hypothetical protein
LRYANAKARYDGLIQSYSDDIDGQIQGMTDYFNSRTGQDGNITLIETNTDKKAFLLSEGVVFDNEGLIDKSQVTDKPLIIIDEEGNKKMISYRDINKVIGQSNAQEHIAYQAEEIRNAVAAQVEQEANTPSRDEVQEAINNVQVEDVVQLNINNNPVTATVQSVNPNTGEIVVQLEKPILNEQGKEQRVVSFPADQFTAALIKQDNTQQAAEPIQTEIAQQQAAPVAEAQTQPAAAVQPIQTESTEQPTSEAETQSQPVKEFPKDKEGFIDYTQITEPQDFAEALMSEFNPEDATVILDDYIAETQKAVKAAEKEKDPIKKRRKIAAEQAKAERYTQIKDIINRANEQEQAETTTQEVVDQPEVEQEINPLSQSEAQELVFVMEQQAEPMPSLDLTPENWYAEFGESGEVKTPIGPVIMGENQYLKMQAKGRAGQFGMVKPTLTNPDVIIEEQSREESVINKRKTNLIFVKTFTDSEGKKHTHFESVTASKENKEVVVSSHIIRPQQLLQKLTDGRIVYTATALNASEQTFAEYPSNTDIGAPLDDQAAPVKKEVALQDEDTTNSENSNTQEQNISETRERLNRMLAEELGSLEYRNEENKSNHIKVITAEEQTDRDTGVKKPYAVYFYIKFDDGKEYLHLYGRYANLDDAKAVLERKEDDKPPVVEYHGRKNEGIAPATLKIAESKGQLDKLKWETSREWNYGFDLEFFRKLGFTFDHYNKYTSDLLLGNVSIPSSTSYTSIRYFNSGELSNKGYEFRITYNAINTADWKLSFNFNISHNENKVEKLPANMKEENYTFGNGNYAVRVIEGDPIGSFYGFP